MTEYHCPTCKSTDVEAYEYVVEGAKAPEKVHVYCNESDCGWVHRGLMRGIFDPGGSEYGEAEAIES